MRSIICPKIKDHSLCSSVHVHWVIEMVSQKRKGFVCVLCDWGETEDDSVCLNDSLYEYLRAMVYSEKSLSFLRVRWIESKQSLFMQHLSHKQSNKSNQIELNRKSCFLKNFCQLLWHILFVKLGILDKVLCLQCLAIRKLQYVPFW